MANAALASPLLRRGLSPLLGLAKNRSLPHYARQRFDRWFARHARKGGATRGEVILWDDTFVRYYEPHIGIAATHVLEAAGFDVILARGRRCCGRPAFSQGHLDRAARLGRHNLALLQETAVASAGCGSHLEPPPIVFLEPSCYSMFAEDYRELKLPGAEQIAQRCFLFEPFLDNLLQLDPQALTFHRSTAPAAIHAHCHAKALIDTGCMVRLAQRAILPPVALLNTGCCGMAGAYGALEANARLSQQIAAPLLALIGEQAPDAWIVASGTSCRQQIHHLSPRHASHMAELLAAGLR